MVKCICGSEEANQIDRQHWLVTEEGETIEAKTNGINFCQCNACGVIRQLTNHVLDYKTYPPSNLKYSKKDYEHDKEVAQNRFETCHDILKDDKILDVGSGSGAFIDVCRKNGAEAYGCEISEYHYKKTDKFTYKKALEDIHFPTDTFDKVTCFDVLEHIVDPIKFLKELLRITRQECVCIIEIPNFFCEEGKHHWKEEHLWFFTMSQLKRVATSVGFEFYGMGKPIPSKMVIYLRKPKQKRVKVLVPPGMGDAYWSIVKMESFMESIGRGGEITDVYVACNKDREFDGHRRAFPFIKLFPFLKSTGISYNTNQYPQELWLEAYRDCGRTIFPDICGCDYLLSWNAYVGAGNKLEDIDPQIKCDWMPPMFESLEQINYMNNSKKQYGKYILFYFIFHGHYLAWLKEFPMDRVVEAVRRIAKQTECTPVFVGAVWDEKNDTVSQAVNECIKVVPDSVDLRGKTTIQELFGLMKGSEMVVGYPSGLTIASTMLKVKTLIVWNEFYHKAFKWRSCPPEVANKTYFVTDTKGLAPQALTTTVKDIINKGDGRLI